MSDLESVFGFPHPPAQREITVRGVTSDQEIGCAYCGWKIAIGQPLDLVVQGETLCFYCHDNEQCARQAGK